MGTKNIILAGYGVVGSILLPLLQSSGYVKVMYGIDPIKERKDDLQRHGVFSYKSIEDIPEEDIKDINVVLDCSTRGHGRNNKRIYEKKSLPAIFQSGETISLASPYFPEKYQSDKTPSYLRICTCPGISTMRILFALEKFCPIFVNGHYYKINNEDSMIDTNYSSGREIEQLFGIPTRINRLYLRGEPKEGYVYASNMQTNLKVRISKEVLKEVLEQGRNIRIVKKNSLDTSVERHSDTLIVEESIQSHDGIVELTSLCYPPEVNFPEILMAINLF
jgi:hypothetical protein